VAYTGNFRLGPDSGRVVIKTSRAGLAAKPLNDGDRRDIKKTMSGILGDGTATFTSSKITRIGASGGAVEGTLTLNGKTQPVRLQLSAPGEGRYRGSATVLQSAFGIKPYSGFFGALKLRDEVTVEFEVDLAKAGPAEAADSAG